jgi:hypothetical protein
MRTVVYLVTVVTGIWIAAPAQADPPLPPGSYLQTCNSCNFIAGGFILNCRCRTIQRAYLGTSIDTSICQVGHFSIRNDNGFLKCP